MQAIVVERTGGPDVLELQERPTPRPRPGEVLVDVSTAGVNYLDIYERSGQNPKPTPFVVGYEGAGTVAA